MKELRRCNKQMILAARPWNSVYAPCIEDRASAHLPDRAEVERCMYCALDCADCDRCDGRGNLAKPQGRPRKLAAH